MDSQGVNISVTPCLHRMTRQETVQLRPDMKAVEPRMRDDLNRLDERMARLDHGKAKLKELVEGLREANTRQPAACCPRAGSSSSLRKHSNPREGAGTTSPSGVKEEPCTH